MVLHFILTILQFTDIFNFSFFCRCVFEIFWAQTARKCQYLVDLFSRLQGLSFWQNFAMLGAQKVQKVQDFGNLLSRFQGLSKFLSTISPCLELEQCKKVKISATYSAVLEAKYFDKNFAMFGALTVQKGQDFGDLFSWGGMHEIVRIWCSEIGAMGLLRPYCLRILMVPFSDSYHRWLPFQLAKGLESPDNSPKKKLPQRGEVLRTGNNF